VDGANSDRNPAHALACGVRAAAPVARLPPSSSSPPCPAALQVLVGVMMASWTVQCWNLEQGAALSSSNQAALGSLASRLDQNLQNFGAAVMAVAGGSGERTAQPAASGGCNPMQPPALRLRPTSRLLPA
jgi:hypothetical protein